MKENIKNNLMIEMIGVTKSYPSANGMFNALSDVSLKILKGQMVALTGKSGSGKSTLLNMIAGIDNPTKGNVIVADVTIAGFSESELSAWRGKNIGVIFQFFQLIPTLTILENVILPMDFCNTFPKAERKSRAYSLLEMVCISDQANKLPSALSGGQQQRASIARALANDPPIIVADEPTGNLDSQNAEAIFQLLTKLSQAGKTIVVVTHEKEFSKYFKHSIIIADGVIMNFDGMHENNGGLS